MCIFFSNKPEVFSIELWPTEKICNGFRILILLYHLVVC